MTIEMITPSPQKLASLTVLAMLMTVAGCSLPDAPKGAPNARASATPPTAKAEAGEKAQVDVVTIRKENVAIGLKQRVRFARVSGLADRSVTERINDLLRRTAEEPLESFERQLGDLNTAGDTVAEPRTTMMESRVTVGRVDSRVAAVRYTFSVNGADFGTVPARMVTSVVTDLATGDELTNSELLSPHVGTVQGARELTRLLAESGPGGRLCDITSPDVRDLTPANILGNGNGNGNGGRGGNGGGDRSRVVDVFPTVNGIEFSLGLWKLGFPMACSPQKITVGYPALTGFLGPALKR